MLEDSNELKSRFEDDYLNLYQRNLALENELKTLTSDAGYHLSFSSKKHHRVIIRSQSLHLSLAERDQEVTALKRIMAESTDTSSPAGEMRERLARAQLQIDADARAARIFEARVKQLEHEKESLVEQACDLKERLSAEGKSAGELRGIIAGFESAGDGGEEGGRDFSAVTHKLVVLQQQNEALHQALKQAREVQLFVYS